MELKLLGSNCFCSPGHSDPDLWPTDLIKDKVQLNLLPIKGENFCEIRADYLYRYRNPELVASLSNIIKW